MALHKSIVGEDPEPGLGLKEPSLIPPSNPQFCLYGGHHLSFLLLYREVPPSQHCFGPTPWTFSRALLLHSAPPFQNHFYPWLEVLPSSTRIPQFIIVIIIIVEMFTYF